MRDLLKILLDAAAMSAGLIMAIAPFFTYVRSAFRLSHSSAKSAGIREFYSRRARVRIWIALFSIFDELLPLSLKLR